MIPRIKHKKILVMGLGLNQGGLSVTDYFAQRGVRVVVTDLKTSSQLASSIRPLRKYPNIIWRLGEHVLADFLEADLIFQNPAVPNNSPFLVAARKKGIPITNEAAFFIQHCPATIVGITGTRGKSTVSTLVYQLLKASRRGKVFLGGNIGSRGLMSILGEARKNDFVVAELSSWQLEHLKAIKASPPISIVTNIYPDHLNRYASYRDYQRAKENIFRYQRKSDVVILNYDNAITRGFARRAQGSVQWFSKRTVQKDGAFLQADSILVKRGKKTIYHIPTSEVSSALAVFPENILPALLVAKKLRVPEKIVRKTVSTFEGLPYRQQRIARYHGTVIINDSCSTAPIAAEKALQGISGSILLICGGVDKDLPYQDLAKTIKQRVKRVVLLPGTASDKLHRELSNISYTSITQVATLEQAVARALTWSKEVDTILFSPAAASFNLFVNEFDRGKKFNHIIHATTGSKKKKRISTYYTQPV